MIKGVKICGVSDIKTLNYIIQHPYPPKFIGFISNYKKSKRYVSFAKLKKLILAKKKKSKFVAVLVSPTDKFLEKLKKLNFDYYQIYDVSPLRINEIKKKYNKKIILAITVKNKNDVKKYKDYKNVDIFLFDGKGYEKSLGFDHNLIKNLPDTMRIMIAGNIKINDIKKFKNSSYILDVSGALENKNGNKDINKIDKFLNSVHNN